MYLILTKVRIRAVRGWGWEGEKILGLEGDKNFLGLEVRFLGWVIYVEGVSTILHAMI